MHAGGVAAVSASGGKAATNKHKIYIYIYIYIYNVAAIAMQLLQSCISSGKPLRRCRCNLRQKHVKTKLRENIECWHKYNINRVFMFLKSEKKSQLACNWLCKWLWLWL